MLLEFRKEDPDVPIRAEHKMSVTEVRAELEAEGYRKECDEGKCGSSEEFVGNFVQNRC